jgi:glycolate oxidase
VIEVESAAEISTIFEIANGLRSAVYVRQGAGAVTIDLLSPFPPGCVIVDLRRLDNIAMHREAGNVEVGPAVTLMDANAHIGRFGYRFPISVEPVTWGGLVSVNLSGHLVDAHSGKPGDYVQGLEVVLPTAEVIQTGTRGLRKPVGPDLTRMFIGNQGLFGVITKLRLRLVRSPAAVTHGWAVFQDVESLAKTVQDMYVLDSPLPLIAELVESTFANVSGMTRHVPSGHVLLLEADGGREEEAEWKLDSLLAISERNGATTSPVDAGVWQALWKIRASPHLHMGGDYLVGDVVDAPLDRLGEALEALIGLRTSAEAKWEGIRGQLWGHVGSGTIHPAYSCPVDWPYMRRAEVAAWLRDRIMNVRLDIGATVGEQGIFPQHLDWYAKAYGTTSLELLAKIRRVFDPNGILNPDRTVARLASQPKRQVS